MFLAQNYLGDAYCQLMRPSDAIHQYELALELNPNDPNVITNLSVCHWHLGNYLTAYLYGRQVKEQAPINYGMLSLMMGDYYEGWNYWEYLDTAVSVPGLSHWKDGEDVTDCHVLVLDEEQGYGDTIMMARFLPQMAKHCRKVTFQTRPALVKLMQASFHDIEVVTSLCHNEVYDKQMRLFSLPKRFKARPDPDQAAYLHADERFNIDRNRMKVGLCWHGSAEHPMEAIRTIHDLSLLQPLADVDVIWVSLVQDGPVPFEMHRYELDDFADTAALIQSLDLVITVDTAVANLAGAMGKETWLMDRIGTDWRWGTESDTGVWYPSVQVFRQPVFGDWVSVVECVKTALLTKASPCN